MIRRRWPGRDRGAFTAEFAVGLPALMVMLFAGLTAEFAASTKAQCVDAAREGALAAARGDAGAAAAVKEAPGGAGVTVTGDRDSVTVTVRVLIHPLGLHLASIPVTASATAAREEPLS